MRVLSICRKADTNSKEIICRYCCDRLYQASQQNEIQNISPRERKFLSNFSYWRQTMIVSWQGPAKERYLCKLSTIQNYITLRNDYCKFPLFYFVIAEFVRSKRFWRDLATFGRVQKNILSNNLSTRVLKENSTEKSMKTAFQLVLLITRN